MYQCICPDVYRTDVEKSADNTRIISAIAVIYELLSRGLKRAGAHPNRYTCDIEFAIGEIRSIMDGPVTDVLRLLRRMPYRIPLIKYRTDYAVEVQRALEQTTFLHQDLVRDE